MLYKVFFTLYAPNELHVSYSGKYLMNERRMSGLSFSGLPNRLQALYWSFTLSDCDIGQYGKCNGN